MMKPIAPAARPRFSSIGGMNELKMGQMMEMPKKPKPRMNVLRQGKGGLLMQVPWGMWCPDSITTETRCKSISVNFHKDDVRCLMRPCESKVKAHGFLYIT